MKFIFRKICYDIFTGAISDGETQDTKGYSVFPAPLHREIVKSHFPAGWYWSADSGCRYFSFEWLLVRYLATLMSNVFSFGRSPSRSRSIFVPAARMTKKHDSLWHVQRHYRHAPPVSNEYRNCSTVGGMPVDQFA